MLLTLGLVEQGCGCLEKKGIGALSPSVDRHCQGPFLAQ